MPESRVRKSTESKKKQKAAAEAKPKKVKSPASRRWVPPDLHHGRTARRGLADRVLHRGSQIPFMAALGNWNILIGMGGMAAAFGIATLWK